MDNEARMQLERYVRSSSKSWIVSGILSACIGLYGGYRACEKYHDYEEFMHETPVIVQYEQDKKSLDLLLKYDSELNSIEYSASQQGDFSVKRRLNKLVDDEKSKINSEIDSLTKKIEEGARNPAFDEARKMRNESLFIVLKSLLGIAGVFGLARLYDTIAGRIMR